MAAPAQGRVLMVMHGSPDEGYAQQADAFLQAWRRYYPEIDASPCFLEHQQPLLAELLRRDDARRYRCVVPLFLSEGRHVRRDIPALAARLPGLNVCRPLVDEGTMADVMIARLEEMPNLAGHLLIYSHGSRDDHHSVDRIAEVLRLRLEWPVSVVLASEGKTRLEQAIRQDRDAGAASITIVPHFLFEGRWRQHLEESIVLLRRKYGFRSIAITRALGEHPAMFALIERRIRECTARH